MGNIAELSLTHGYVYKIGGILFELFWEPIAGGQWCLYRLTKKGEYCHPEEGEIVGYGLEPDG